MRTTPHIEDRGNKSNTKQRPNNQMVRASSRLMYSNDQSVGYQNQQIASIKFAPKFTNEGQLPQREVNLQQSVKYKTVAAKQNNASAQKAQKRELKTSGLNDRDEGRVSIGGKRAVKD